MAGPFTQGKNIIKKEVRLSPTCTGDGVKNKMNFTKTENRNNVYGFYYKEAKGYRSSEVVECHDYRVAFENGNVEIVAGNIDLRGTKFLTVNGDLSVFNATIQWDNDIVITINGDLTLNHCSFELLPEVKTKGDINLTGSSCKEILNVECGGCFTPTTTIEVVKDLTVHEHAWFERCYYLKQLPERMVVDGDLEFYKCWDLKKYPKYLFVRGDFKVSFMETQFDESDDSVLVVVGNASFYSTTTMKLPKNTTIVGHLGTPGSKNLKKYIKNNKINNYESYFGLSW